MIMAAKKVDPAVSKALSAIARRRWANTTPEERKAASEHALTGLRKRSKREMRATNRANAAKITPEAAKARAAKAAATKRAKARAAAAKARKRK